MKLISGNSRIACFVLLFLCACHQKSETDFLIGNWKTIQIQKNESPLFEIMDNDHLIIRPDSTFEYSLESVKKQMSGTWSYSQHTLHLKYNEPDTVRHFTIDILSKYELRMHEDSVLFIYQTAQ